MGHHPRRWTIGVTVLLLLTSLGVGCAHTREVFYPHVPRRAARIRLAPRLRAPAPAVGARVVPKPRVIIKVE